MVNITQSLLISFLVFLIGVILIDAAERYDAKQDAEGLTIVKAAQILNHPDNYSPYLIHEAVRYMNQAFKKQKAPLT